jgi:signal transduction histidine kinase
VTISSSRPYKPDTDRTDTDATGLLLDIAAICRTMPAGEETWRQVLALLRRAVPFDASTLYLYDNEEDLKIAASLDGRVRADGEQTEDYASDLSVPLLAADKVIGILSLGRRENDPVGDKDRVLVSITADLLAMTIQARRDRDRINALDRQIVEAGVKTKDTRRYVVVAERLSAASELATSINHQINNPLAVIVGNVQCLLLSKQITDEKTIARLKVIEKAALTVSEINRKLTNISRLAREEEKV